MRPGVEACDVLSSVDDGSGGGRLLLLLL